MTIALEQKWKSLCDNPVSCTTQPIYCLGDILILREMAIARGDKLKL
jgi:hypothetical protein